MKKWWNKIIVFSLAGLTLLFTYKLIYSYTIIRIETPIFNENIMGIKFTTFNLLNPIKEPKMRSKIKIFLKDLSTIGLSQKKIAYLNENLLLDDDFEILDMYRKEGKIYIFTSFKVKENETVINRLLFILNNRYEVKRVLF
jgi:hypothetical protein